MLLDSCINYENTNGLTAGTKPFHRSCVCEDLYLKRQDTLTAYGGFGCTSLLKYVLVCPLIDFMSLSRFRVPMAECA
jgi:hypothetical protein